MKGNARIIINKEVARVSIEALQRLNERDVLVTFPAQKPHCTTRLVLKTPKTETSTRVVWLPKTVAHMLVEHRKNQEELKEFLGADYHDYNLVVALENGNPVESRIIRKRLQVFCDTTGYERVDFHSLRHLSTKYKLKLTQGDIKSVQGDTGHAEAQMVTDVYSEIEDENRRENALAWKPTSTALPLKMGNHQQQRISAKLWRLSLRTCHLSNFQLLSPLPVSSGC